MMAVMERRKVGRELLHLEVRYRFEEQPSTIDRMAWTENTSEMGIRLWSNEQLIEGQTIRCLLRQGPQDTWWPEVIGTVIWQGAPMDRSDGLGYVRPTGIFFSVIEDAVRERVRQVLQLKGKGEPDTSEALVQNEQLCTRCILTSAVPGIRFNESGVCNFCVDYEKKEAPKRKDHALLEKQLLTLLRTDPKKYPYDCLCLYSGGKDSSYMLHLLANKYKLRVLAFTFDNWFIPSETYANIKKVLSKTSADHILFRPSWDLNKAIFRTGMTESHRLPATKELAFMIGHACWPCFTQIAVHSMRLAIEKHIPNVVVGTTPGQIRQKRYDLVSKFGGILDVYQFMIAPMLKLLALTKQEVAKTALTLRLSQKFHVLKMRLIPFYEYIPYSERLVVSTVQNEFGWEMPRSTDSCSTNCQLNSLGIELHKKHYGLSPYIIPLARDVREGLVDRGEALKAIRGGLNSKLIQGIATRFEVEI